MPRHLLSIEELSKEELLEHLINAAKFVEISERDIKKVPALRGKTVINLFLEPSTRTRASFEIAGKRLSGDVINISASSSSTVKGETLLDTARTLEAMSPDILVVRHKESGAAHFLATRLRHTSVVNAGDGLHEHPSQALLDCLSLMQRFQKGPEGICGLKIAIIGDVSHSRVARSNIWAHKLLGNHINLVGPPTFIPPDFAAFGGKDVSVFYNLEEGVAGADVVMCLRLQLERQEQNFVPSLQEYSNEYIVTEDLLRRVAPKAVIMHPGPVNRGTEVESVLIDGPRSLMREQVRNGVAVRMAILFGLAAGSRQIGEE
ncbi:MAG: aspartate carbamoyltransferase catalytic subunit [Deltaproteobacteria bacterium]|nr:aspartate carbamoyltransferase catalytic subunit [Deltaproteobacteria bacterium]